MEDKLITINHFLNNNGRFNIPFRTRKLLFYSKEQPQDVGPSISFKVSFNIKFNNRPITDEMLKIKIT